MPNDNKYQCLVDATAASGIQLPPIKPGTDVTSNGRPFDPERDSRFPELAREFSGMVAIFTYPGADGSKYDVVADDLMSNGTGDRSLGFLVGRGVYPAHDGGGPGGDFSAIINPAHPRAETIEGGGLGRPWRRPAVEDTVDKIFKCLDPLTS